MEVGKDTPNRKRRKRSLENPLSCELLKDFISPTTDHQATDDPTGSRATSKRTICHREPEQLHSTKEVHDFNVHGNNYNVDYNFVYNHVEALPHWSGVPCLLYHDDKAT